MGPLPEISLVIPARNEEAYLPVLLASVDVSRHRHPRGPAVVEVIVADNASTDATARVAASHGCTVARAERRCIASVRNAGAAAARGGILAFVDADSRIHPDTFATIDRALSNDRVVAGATGVRLERWSLGIVAAYAMLYPWVVLLRMDTGVVFCRRADFEAIGGYDEGRLFGEDVQLLWDLRRLGRRRGQHLVRLRKVKALASMRKFDRFGDWHYFRRMPRLAVMMLTDRNGANEFAKRYWYGDER